jgi:poly-gamma-glutamate system protein
MWGANDPEFTYLDMESVLERQGVIAHRTVAASMGGGEDVGRSISQAGRDLISAAINRNNVAFISGSSLSQNVEARRRLYAEKSQGRPYRAFVNVGGGIAILGSTLNGDLIPPGLNKTYLPMNYPARGLIHEFWERGTPVIHLLNVDRLADQYGLPKSPVPLPPVGSGKIFVIERYDLRVAGFSAGLLLVILLAVVLLDRDKYKLREEGVDPDTLM